ncbi:MAG: hypothetical protein AAF494_05135 [Pseudomonadota bacterium]
MFDSERTAASQPDNTIVIEETGVADSYEATKTISCADVRWYVAWKSQGSNQPIAGSVSISMAGEKRRSLDDAQTEVFGKFSSVQDVSATCNPAKGDQPTRTTLLVLGQALENGQRALAQVNVEQDFAVNWSFDLVDES